MSLRINDTAPDFAADTTEGRIRFHEWIGDGWAVLFSHPKDFTPVCTTELGYMARIKPEFDKRGVKILGISVDPVDDHKRWADSKLPKTRPLFRRSKTMGLTIGDTAPDFEAETTEGTIKFHDWLGDSWGVLFSHPRAFTPVCTTELGYMASIKPEFDKRGVKIIGISVDPVDNTAKWSEDIGETQGTAPNYPIIGDSDFAVSKAYGMLPADVEGEATSRTPADNATVRNVFVIGPDKKIKLILVYPMTTGRNFDEVLRVIDSLQLTAKHKVATPAQWQQGDDVIIAGSVSNDEAKQTYPDGWQEPRPYIRIVPQPSETS
jgi:alkyl hydroperoxide reductase subunit AhpC